MQSYPNETMQTYEEEKKIHGWYNNYVNFAFCFFFFLYVSSWWKKESMMIIVCEKKRKNLKKSTKFDILMTCSVK